jgi:hypothetical protein
MYLQDAYELRKHFLIYLLKFKLRGTNMHATYLTLYENILDATLASQLENHELL